MVGQNITGGFYLIILHVMGLIPMSVVCFIRCCRNRFCCRGRSTAVFCKHECYGGPEKGSNTKVFVYESI